MYMLCGRHGCTAQIVSWGTQRVGIQEPSDAPAQSHTEVTCPLHSPDNDRAGHFRPSMGHL